MDSVIALSVPANVAEIILPRHLWNTTPLLKFRYQAHMALLAQTWRELRRFITVSHVYLHSEL